MHRIQEVFYVFGSVYAQNIKTLNSVVFMHRIQEVSSFLIVFVYRI